MNAVAMVIPPAQQPAAANALPAARAEAEPYAWEGDDDHIIFWMLSLTPTERLAALQGFADSFLKAQDGRSSPV